MPSLTRLTAHVAALATFAALAAPAAQAATLPLQHASTTVADVPHDGVVAPGDVLTIRETLTNGGPSTITGLQGTLTSLTPGVTVDQGASAYPDIAAAGTQQNSTPFTVSLSPTLACGTAVNLSLALTSAGDTATVPLTVPTGNTGPLTSYDGVYLVIGDARPTLHHLASIGPAPGTASVNTAGVVRAVEVNIGDLQHPDISHLSISLRAPGEQSVALVNAGLGVPGGKFVNTELMAAGSPLASGVSPFTGNFRADGDLGAFAGASQQGIWQLAVVGGNPPEIGRVNTWTLKIATADCTPLAGAKLVVPPGPFNPGAPVALDASTSTSVDPGGITQYEWDLDDGNGFVVGPSSLPAAIVPQGVHTVRVRVRDAGGVIGIASATVIVSWPPLASIVLPGTNPKQNHYVTLDGSGSTDPDLVGIARYDWDVDNDGQYDDATGAQPSVYFGEGGPHPIHLKVTDMDGATGTATATLTVTATQAPVASITATPGHVAAGQPVVFDAGGSTDDGTIVGYEWDLDGNGTFETVSGSSPSAGRSYPNGAALNVAVRVTDNDDRTGVAYVLLTVDAPPGAGGGATGTGADPSAPGGGADARPGAGTTEDGAPAGPSGPLGASLGAAAIQGLKIVGIKGLGLRCSADRAATCTVTATLQPADARRAGLSKSRKKPYVLGKATARLKQAGAATVTVHVTRRVMRKLARIKKLVVIVDGNAVDGSGAKVVLRRAVLLRR